jgi:hypothetical protein
MRTDRRATAAASSVIARRTPPAQSRLLWAAPPPSRPAGALRHFPDRWFLLRHPQYGPLVQGPSDPSRTRRRHSAKCRAATASYRLGDGRRAVCLPFAGAPRRSGSPVSPQLHIWLPVLGLSPPPSWDPPASVKAVHVGIGYVTLFGARSGFLRSLDPVARGAGRTTTGQRHRGVEPVASRTNGFQASVGLSDAETVIALIALETFECPRITRMARIGSRSAPSVSSAVQCLCASATSCLRNVYCNYSSHI